MNNPVRAFCQDIWIDRSIDTAFNAGANIVSLIPTRAGNGALDQLRTFGEFHEPTIQELESAQECALHKNSGLAFADTWDAERFCPCKECAPARIAGGFGHAATLAKPHRAGAGSVVP